jgi:hypothetical protein
MKINATKIAIAAAFVFCMFSATAHAQLAPVLPNVPQVLTMQEHPLHASQHPMGQESSLLNNWTYTYAQGEVPLAELGTLPPQVPLGDVARTYRKEHAKVPKAVLTYESN